MSQDLDAVEKQILAFSKLDHPQRALTENLSYEPSSFLCFMSLFKVLKAMPLATEDERLEMLKFCRHYYRHNTNMLNDIENFRQTYRPDQAINWYTKATFIYKYVIFRQ